MVSFPLAPPRALAKGWQWKCFFLVKCLPAIFGPQGAVRNLVYDYPVVLGAGVSAKYLEIPEQNPLSIRSSISCTETQECCPEIQGSRVGFEVDLSHPVRATVMCQLGP